MKTFNEFESTNESLISSQEIDKDFLDIVHVAIKPEMIGGTNIQDCGSHFECRIAIKLLGFVIGDSFMKMIKKLESNKKYSFQAFHNLQSGPAFVFVIRK